MACLCCAGGYTNDTRFYLCNALCFGVRVVNYKFLTLALLLAFGSSSHAGYALLSPPVGWSQGGAAASTYKFSAAAANDVSFTFNTVRTSAALNVGGRSVVMPVAMRLAANAPLIAARFAFFNPALLLLGAAGAAYNFYQESGYEVVGGVWKKKVQTGFCASGSCFEYGDANSQWVSSVQAAAATFIARANASGTFRYSYVSGNPLTGEWVAHLTYVYEGANDDYGNVPQAVNIRPVPPSTGSEYRDATQSEFESEMSPFALPEGVPQALPVPLPVEDPVINPSPGAEPVPRPLRLPQGEPQLVPNSNPPQWKSPVVDVVPAPTADEPWRVDLQPKDITKTDPSPVTTIPAPDPTSAETPKEEVSDLCKLNPDILACSKPEFDTPDSQDLETLDKQIQITPDSGWGAGAGSCPAPRHLSGANIDFEFTGFCNFMTGLKPVLLAFAWLSAALIVLGVRNSSD